VIIAGISLFYPLAGSITEQLLFVNWTIYISLYGVFFYHFPLPKITKWSVNCPFSKLELIGFNIIYQCYKIILTLGTLISTFVLEYRFFEKNLYVNQLNNNLDILKESFFAPQTKILRDEFLPSTILLTAIIAFLFLLSFIFNVAPYAPFNNKLFSWQHFTSQIKFYFSKFFYQSITIIIIAISLVIFSEYFYSKAFIGGLITTSLMLIVYLTYERILIFNKSTTYLSVLLTLSAGIFMWFGLLNYSEKILLKKNITLIQRIEERDFQGIQTFNRNPQNTLLSILAAPNLCDPEIKKIMSYYLKKQMSNIKETIPLSSFENIVLNKSECGLGNSLKLFNVLELSVEQINQYLALWMKLSPPQSIHDFEDITSPFYSLHLSKKVIESFIKSKNPIAQYLSLKLIEKKPFSADYESIFLHKNYFHKKMFIPFANTVSTITCTDYSIIDFIENRKPNFSTDSCRRGRKISSIVPFYQSKDIDQLNL